LSVAVHRHFRCARALCSHDPPPVSVRISGQFGLARQRISRILLLQGVQTHLWTGVVQESGEEREEPHRVALRRQSPPAHRHVRRHARQGRRPCRRWLETKAWSAQVSSSVSCPWVSPKSRLRKGCNVRRVGPCWIAWKNLHGAAGARGVRGGGLRFNSSSKSAKATSLFHALSFSTVMTRSSGTESVPANTTYPHVQHPLPAARSPPPPQADWTNKVAKNTKASTADGRIRAAVPEGNAPPNWAHRISCSIFTISLCCGVSSS